MVKTVFHAVQGTCSRIFFRSGVSTTMISFSPPIMVREHFKYVYINGSSLDVFQIPYTWVFFKLYYISPIQQWLTTLKFVDLKTIILFVFESFDKINDSTKLTKRNSIKHVEGEKILIKSVSYDVFIILGQHKTLIQCGFNVGPPSATLTSPANTRHWHWPHVVSTFKVLR